jgi:hypothetical protein
MTNVAAKEFGCLLAQLRCTSSEVNGVEAVGGGGDPLEELG